MEFLDATKIFLRLCKIEKQLSRHTLEAYEGDLADFKKWLPPRMKLRKISTTDLKDYLKSMVEERKLTAATVRRRLACLRVFFRYVSSVMGMKNPFAEWRPLIPRRRRLPRTLSRVETTSLLSMFLTNELLVQRDEPEALGTAVRLMLATGLRVGELCSIRIDDVSPDASTLRVLGKGARDRIAYVVDAGLRKSVQHLIADRRKLSAGVGPLFVNRLGSAMRPQSIRSKLRQCAITAGISRRVTPHMLRHTAATLLIETGVDIRFVQRLLGHSTIATTEIYAHVSDEALRTRLEEADVLRTLSAR